MDHQQPREAPFDQPLPDDNLFDDTLPDEPATPTFRDLLRHLACDPVVIIGVILLVAIGAVVIFTG